MRWQDVIERVTATTVQLLAGVHQGVDLFASEALTTWAKHGWLVHPLLSYVRPDTVINLFATPVDLPGSRERAERELLEWFDTLLEPLAERCRRDLRWLALADEEARLSLFNQALWAYRHKAYGLVAPTLYPQLEGIITSMKGYAADAVFSRRADRVKARDAWLSNLRQNATRLLPRTTDARFDALKAGLALLSEHSGAPHLTRHDVAHGGVGHNTKAEAAKALLVYMTVVGILASPRFRVSAASAA